MHELEQSSSGGGRMYELPVDGLQGVVDARDEVLEEEHQMRTRRSSHDVDRRVCERSSKQVDHRGLQTSENGR